MKTLKVFGINLLVLAALLLCCELTFRLVYPDYRYYEQTYAAKFEAACQIHPVDTNWVKVDTALGWVCRQREQLRFYLPAFHHIAYGINAEGFRHPSDFADLPPKGGRRRVLLLGDSFLFGLFLPDSLTISQQLQRRLGEGVEVLNIAVPAWGLDQMYLAYQQYREQLDVDQVIILYIDDDISRLVEAFYWGVACKPAFKVEAGRLKPRSPTDGALGFLGRSTLFQSQLINHCYHQYCERQAIPIAEALFDSLMQTEQKLGRELMVLRCPRIQQIPDASSTTPFDHDAFFATKKMTYYNLQNNIAALPAAQQQQLYVPQDGHLSAEGALFIAQLTAQQIYRPTQPSTAQLPY
ncbi:MAG: hypothetical protein AAGG75_27585 [Bacteroidota bacterium]